MSADPPSAGTPQDGGVPALERTAARGGYMLEIRVRGVLSERLLRAFPSLEATIGNRDTVLAGALRDQAELYGVLGEVEGLGLDLLELSVNRID